MGFKSRFQNGQVAFNGAAYSYQHDDLQVSSFNAETVSLTISNAASATVDGVELDVSYESPADLLLYAAMAYNKARYEDFVTTCYANPDL